ncbi:MAG: hypothetical protein LBM77_02025 [Spirochaetaceae bacterium]|jgi:hypothetical protein|nr:hypothetical protein [Spirochaetaceae bacterium]
MPEKKKSPLLTIIAFFCIIIYAGALGFAAYRVWTSVKDRTLLAEKEFFALADLASGAGAANFMNDSFQTMIQDALDNSLTLEALIISGPSGEYAFERKRGDLINWVGSSPRFSRKFPVSSTPFYSPIRMEGLRNVSISAVFQYIDYGELITILKYTLMLTLGGLAIALISFVIDSVYSKNKQNPALAKVKPEKAQKVQKIAKVQTETPEAAPSEAAPPEESVSDLSDFNIDDITADDFNTDNINTDNINTNNINTNNINTDDNNIDDMTLPELSDDAFPEFDVKDDTASTDNRDTLDSNIEDIDTADALDTTIQADTTNTTDNADSSDNTDIDPFDMSAFEMPDFTIDEDSTGSEAETEAAKTIAEPEAQPEPEPEPEPPSTSIPDVVPTPDAEILTQIDNALDESIRENTDLSVLCTNAVDEPVKILKGYTLNDAIEEAESMRTGDAYIGISSRAGRSVKAERLLFEARSALDHAKTTKDSPIIGFQVDPTKWAEFQKNAL